MKTAQLYPHEYVPSLTNDSDYILTNLESAFWTNQIATIQSLHLYEDGPIRDHGQGLLPM